MNWDIGVNRETEYRKFCAEAATDDKAFASFKRHPRLIKIFEHTTTLLAQQYLEEIRRDNPWLLNYMKNFASSDTIGGGQPQNIGGYLISPSTMKYAGVLNRLIKNFDSLEGMNIIEIGGGYGGQYKIISEVFTPASYTIVDLPESLALTERYLSEFKYQLEFTGITPDLKDLPPPNSNWDLCIASYSLTELSKPIQSNYKDRILDCSMMGFIQCNKPFTLKYGQRSADVSDRDTDFVWSWNLDSDQ